MLHNRSAYRLKSSLNILEITLNPVDLHFFFACCLVTRYILLRSALECDNRSASTTMRKSTISHYRLRYDPLLVLYENPC